MAIWKVGLRTSVNYFYKASFGLKYVLWESTAKLTQISLCAMVIWLFEEGALPAFSAGNRL